MRRFLVLTCVTVLFGLLVAVAPAVVRPDANRAEATVGCEDTGGGNFTLSLSTAPGKLSSRSASSC